MDQDLTVLFAVSIVCGLLGYGLVVATWSIISAATARLAKPTAAGMVCSFLAMLFIEVLAAVIMFPFDEILVSHKLGYWMIGCLTLLSVFFSTAGACFGNHRSFEELEG